MNTDNRVSNLLTAIHDGDGSARDELYSLVEDGLRSIAKNFLRSEPPGQSLQTTLLINEAFLRLVGPTSTPRRFEHHQHFYRTASRVMRHLLIDQARRRARSEENLSRVDIQLHDLPDPDLHSEQFELLDEALEKLSKLYPRQSEIIELRYFCNFNILNIAEQFSISASMVKKEITAAKAWLHRELTRSEHE